VTGSRQSLLVDLEPVSKLLSTRHSGNRVSGYPESRSDKRFFKQKISTPAAIGFIWIPDNPAVAGFPE
jgi:hypothetical protein